MSFMEYKPAEQDYRFWLVVNPARWMIPMAVTVLVVAVLVHLVAYSLPGQGYPRGHAAKAAAAPVAAEAPAAK
jgi:light-harvesting protein B-800-850 alpha chain